MQGSRSGFSRRALWAGAVIFGTAILSSPRVRAQDVAWTHTQIANVNGAMPSIEVDRLGYVHVGWTLNMGGASYYAYHSTNASGDYAHTLVDSKTTGSPSPYFPYLTTDSLGFFHMVWRELSLTGRPVFYRTNNPETRALVKMSFNSSGHSHDPYVDVTGDNIAHVITEADSCTGCASGSNLYDESFTATTAYAGRVTTLVQDANDGTGLQQFSSAVTPDGTRHLVFSMRLAPPADNQRLIYYSSRAPGGLTWSTPVSITGHQDNYQGWPGIVSDPAGNLHVVYSSEDYGIYYVKMSDGVWSTPLRINDQNTVLDAIPSVAIDPNGRLHVVFQRYTPVPGQSAVVSLHYTTNAFDANNWLDPASQVLTNVGTFQLTHQNRKIGVNWVDGQVLVPYQAGATMWLASTTDVPVTPVTPGTPGAVGGTSTLSIAAGFTPPVEINRTLSNTAMTATSVLRFRITDGGGDSAATRISTLHVNAGGAQSFPTVTGKAEGLSYLLAGAQLVTGSGQTITAVVADKKLVFRDVNHALWVPSGGTQTFDLQIWMKNQAYVTGKIIDLRIKPDQDVVTEAAGSVMAVDQPVVGTDGMLVVDNNAQCPTGTACNDGNPCTHTDMCNNSNICVGLTVTCNSDPCNARTCNGTATCTATPVACGGGGVSGGSGGAGVGGMTGGGSTGGATMGGGGGAAAGGASAGGGMTGGGSMGGAPGSGGSSTGGGSGGASAGGMMGGGSTGGAPGSGGVPTGGGSGRASAGGMTGGGMAGGGLTGGAVGSGGLSTGIGSGGASGGLSGGGGGGMWGGNAPGGTSASGGTTNGGSTGGLPGGGGNETSPDAGAAGGGAPGGGVTPGGESSGCGCGVGSGSDAAPGTFLGLALALLFGARARRRTRSGTPRR